MNYVFLGVKKNGFYIEYFLDDNDKKGVEDIGKSVLLALHSGQAHCLIHDTG